MDEGTNTNSNNANTVSAASPADSGATDISKTTVTILVLLTLMISVIGTWTVLSEVNNVKVVKQESSSVGKVSLTIQGPEEPAPSATGRVALNLLESR